MAVEIWGYKTLSRIKLHILIGCLLPKGDRVVFPVLNLSLSAARSPCQVSVVARSSSSPCFLVFQAFMLSVPRTSL